MATVPKEEPRDGIHEVTKEEPEHTFYATAHVLSANLEHPVTREVEREAHVRLHPDGTYKFQPSGPLRLEGIIAYESGYTQVGGHKSPKEGHGFVTLTTSVVEGLNILDVLTADRVVGQISTEHPVWDPRQPLHVPTVTFLGTRFENLRIDGHEVELETQLDILGPEPVDDKSYHENEGVLRRVFEHYTRIKGTDWAKDEKRGWNQAPGQPYGDMKCSLVRQIHKTPGTPVGHVIDLPHFGKIFLAELTVNRKKAEPSNNGKPNPEKYHFTLEMIRVELGCLAQGTATAGALSSNGTGGKG
jgi:hypothetical protein